MSTPPDFLGMALGMIQQKRQREAQQQQGQIAQERLELQSRRLRDKDQEEAFSNALTLIQNGSDPEATIARYGDKLKYGDMKFLKAEGKHMQESLLNKANTPKGAEMTDVATGLAAIQQNNPDPLRGALDRLRAEKSLPYPPAIQERLGNRADFMRQSQQAKAERERLRVTEQSKITEERQGRMLAARAGAAKQTKETAVPAAVESAWQTYRASGSSFADWMQNPEIPTVVKTNAMKHPEYIGRMRRKAEPPPKTFQGVPYALPESGQATSAPPAGLAAPAPTGGSGGWVDIGGGVRVRKKE